MAKKLFKEKQQFKGIEIIGLVVLLMVGIVYKMVSELIQPSETLWFTLGLSIGLLTILGYILKYMQYLPISRTHIYIIYIYIYIYIYICIGIPLHMSCRAPPHRLYGPRS